MSFNIDLKKLVTSILIPLAVGGISAFITRDDMDIYSRIKRPPLSPPSWIFPVVWTILYILMGISLYLVRIKKTDINKKTAYISFAVQLFLNFIWSPIFFSMGAYVLAFVVLILLWLSVMVMILLFGRIDRRAAYLNIPYLVWLTFAAYLNLAIAILNR